MIDLNSRDVTRPLDAGHDRLPIAALLAFAMTGFTAIMTETLPAGLLPQIAAGFQVTESMAGQMITAYAAGSLIAAIPLIALTQGWRRKPTLLAAVTGFLIFNTVTAISANFWIAMGARAMAGIAAGLAWAILVGYARRMVVDRLKGRAVAIAMVGTPIALSIGVPIGTFAGAWVGWRMAFLGMSATTVILILWILRSVPDFPGQTSAQRLSLGAVGRMPGVGAILLTILAWVTGHNLLYTYIAPIAALSGLSDRIDVVLLGFGCAALIGIWSTGLLVDRMLRSLVLASLTAFGCVAALLSLFADDPIAVVAATLLWGLSFGGAATQLTTALADSSGDGVDLANAMLTTVWNGAIAIAGLVGGLLLERFDAQALPLAALALAILGLLIVMRSYRAGFTPGRRGQRA